MFSNQGNQEITRLQGIVGQVFEVFTESSVTFKPGKRSFDNPSFRNNGKFTGMV